MKLQPGITWSSYTRYVDIDTGEIITEKKAKDINKYIIIKTIKNVKVNELQTRGHISYTKECRKQPQTKLKFE